ncbi:MAG: hypothetical protein DCC67_14570 [Planctomycetota bacterium]|nr:MAG: hypothetical protein DCC67_14570 [Planctomycetota bacterium]
MAIADDRSPRAPQNPPGPPVRAACGLALAALGLLSALPGCGSSQRYAVSGTITVGGEPVDTGRVFFVPVEGAKGPRVQGEIIGGQYRVTAQGGLLAGKYRVELDAKKKTGRKIRGRIIGGEFGEVDETISMAPRIYQDADSPLIVEVPGATETIDIAVPAA